MAASIPLDQWLTVTVRQACELSGLGKTTMHALLAQKKVQSRLVEGRRLVSVASLRNLILPEKEVA